MRAYAETYELPITITNCANNYGPYQFPEKLIPHFCTLALDDRRSRSTPAPRTAGSGCTSSTTARPSTPCSPGAGSGETYHVGSGVEASIMEVADRILAALGKPASLKKIVPDRPGHDRRYVLDSSKLRRELGWAPSVDWEQGLADTVAWYADHRDWWEPLRGPGPGGRGRLGSPEGARARVRILVTGADGQLGPRPGRRPGRDACPTAGGGAPCSARRARAPGPDHEVLGTDIGTMPVDDRDAVLHTFAGFRPELVLHGGAFTAVDLCETETDLAFAVNAIGTRHVAEAAALVGAHLVYVSTDYVFDGTSARPYREWDPPCPTSVYGASKLAGERECRPGSTIVRTSWVCGAHGKNIVKHRAAAGPRRRRAPLRRRPAAARPRSPPTWPRPSSPSVSTAGPAPST